MTIFHDMARKHRARRQYWISLARLETCEAIRPAQVAFARAAHLSFMKTRRIAKRFER